MNDIGVVHIRNGGFCVVDADMVESVNKHKWYRNTMGQPITHIGTKCVQMGRLILNPPDGVLTDHVNGVMTDNRRSNLRPCNYKQNSHNSRKQTRSKPCWSKYKGVSYQPKRKKWMASLKADGKYVFLGRHGKEIDAAIAYNNAARKHFGEFARLNNISTKLEVSGEQKD